MCDERADLQEMQQQLLCFDLYTPETAVLASLNALSYRYGKTREITVWAQGPSIDVYKGP